MVATIIWSAPDWLKIVAAGISLVLLATLMWAYLQTASSAAVRFCAGAFKAVGILLLVLCLLEPLFSGTRPRTGANVFVVLADNSQSLQLHDPGVKESRGERLREQLAEKTD